MKKRLLYLFMLLPLLGFLASCEDDNEIRDEYAETSGDNWEGVSGMYRGKMQVHFDGVAIDTMYQQAEITSDDRNRMNLRINSIVVNDDIEFNSLFFKDVYFTKEGDIIAFNAKTVQNMGLLANISLDLQGVIAGGDLDLKITAQSVTIRPVEMYLKGSKLDKPLNSKSEIRKMTLNNPLVTSQPDFGYSYSSLTGGINLIYVYVTDTLRLTDSTELLIRPEFELSEGATISYPDSVMNFAGKEVTYTVWAEDSIHRSKYRVLLVQAMVRKFPFNTWKANGNGWEEPESGWATNNGAMKALIDQGAYAGNYPVTRVKGEKTGEWAAQMETVMTGSGESQKIFAGSFFQGNFDPSMQAPLYGPQYGVAFSGKPVSLKGYYKYLPASEVYEGNALYQDTMKFNDTCLIRAILYEIVNPDDVLDSLDYMKDTRVVAVAEMPYYTAGNYQPEFKDFSIYFNYIRNYFFTKRYKMALICSPSKEAGKLKGAPGSKLAVGGIEVMYSNR